VTAIPPSPTQPFLTKLVDRSNAVPLRKVEGPPMSDTRFNWGLITDFFEVLEHGYVKSESNGDRGRAVGILSDLVEAFEGGTRALLSHSDRQPHRSVLPG
jgi:hypothetical protein